jgi:hypothetical protein
MGLNFLRPNGVLRVFLLIAPVVGLVDLALIYLVFGEPVKTMAIWGAGLFLVLGTVAAAVEGVRQVLEARAEMKRLQKMAEEELDFIEDEEWAG